MKVGTTLYVRDRAEWRRWLARHAKREKEIWLVYPKKASGKTRISYNDAVDEALCFGWIDSINKALGKDRYAQRFTPRRPNSKLSAMNRERALRLVAAGRMTKAGQRALGDQLKARPLRMRADVRAALRARGHASSGSPRATGASGSAGSRARGTGPTNSASACGTSSR